MEIFYWDENVPVTANNLMAMEDVLLNTADGMIKSQISINTDGSIELTGRIIDGMPEYLQILDIGACPNNSTKTVSYITDDKIITDFYLIGRSDNNETIKVPNASASSNYFNVFFTSNNITITTNQDRSRFNGTMYIYFTDIP